MSVITTIFQTPDLNAGIPLLQGTDEKVPLYALQNVTRYEYIPSPSSCRLQHRPDNNHSETPTTPEIPILIIDTLYDDAFGHWVYESAIYLSLFRRLRQKLYPNLKLHTKRPRRYKDLFYRFFGIAESDIVESEKLICPNTCIVPLPVSSWNEKSICSVYKTYVDELFDVFAKKIGNCFPKMISVLLSPRARQENYAGNDRQIDVTDIIEKIRDTAKILYTDQVQCLLDDQIRHIAAAKTVILMDGSAYYVNGLFAIDSQILVVGGCCVVQHNQEFPKMNYIHQKILEKNRAVCFPCGTHKVPYSAVKQFLV